MVCYEADLTELSRIGALVTYSRVFFLPASFNPSGTPPRFELSAVAEIGAKIAHAAKQMAFIFNNKRRLNFAVYTTGTFIDYKTAQRVPISGD